MIKGKQLDILHNIITTAFLDYLEISKALWTQHMNG